MSHDQDDGEQGRCDREEGSAQNQGSRAGNDVLATQMNELAQKLQTEDDPENVLENMVRTAIELVPGAQDGAVSVVRARRELTPAAASGDLPVQVDALETELQEGPSIDSIYEQKTVRVSDLRTEKRWPEFAGRATQLGAVSMLAFQLFVVGDTLGALNLYSRGPGAFTDESEHISLMVASHAAVALAQAQKMEQLAEAAGTRDLIGQAKGILMERYKITAHQAFQLLVHVSSRTNTKLRDVAEYLNTPGVLPGPE